MPHLKDKRRAGPPVLLLTGVFCLVLVLGLLAVQAVRANDRILPNVSIGGVDLGGLTPAEAEERLRASLRALNVSGLVFRHEDRSLTIKAIEAGEALPSQAPIAYDIKGLAREAFEIGHDGDAARLIKANIQALFTEIRRPARATVDRDGLRGLLVLRFGSFERPARDAAVSVTATETRVASGTPETSFHIEILPDSTGVSLSYDDAIEQAVSGLDRWRAAAVELEAAVERPRVSTADADAARPRILKVLERGDLVLAYDDKTWSLKPKEVTGLVALKAAPDGSVYIGLKTEALEPLLDEAAEEIESEAKPTRLKIEDGRVVEFEGGAIGKRLSRETSLTDIDRRFESSENGVFPLTVIAVHSPDSDPAAEELGIRELLGYGTSNFAGSPTNRRKNIALGAKKLYGLIIPPGGELALLEHLKPFDASGGWLQELVIKGDRTVPEYGGGLCQIGTTTFRAVMGAGLPVTQRQNHSFRVRYYEPSGTDATIYDPAPDFKFVNDTQHHAVLITMIVKDTLRFELWGTRDGRVQEQGKVRMWDVKPPPEAKLIETSDLPEGQKKCFEKPISGAKTAFTYTITYPDGAVKSQEFRSVYKPWQEQCLIGKPGAPRIVMQKDGSLKELPPSTASAAPPPVQPPGFN
jgi:vancomycin resistance protein YoaR